MIKVAHPSTTLLYAFFQASLNGLTFDVELDGAVRQYTPQELLKLNPNMWPKVLTGHTIELNTAGYPCGALYEEDVTQGDICDEAIKLHFLQSLNTWKMEREASFRDYEQLNDILASTLTQEGDHKLTDYLSNLLTKQMTAMI